MQQLKIIEDYIIRNRINTKVISCKTARDKNGLALSSRNFLLSEKQKIIASKIYKLIINNKRYLIKKMSYLNSIKKKIINLGVAKIDYIEIVDINKIIKPFKMKKKFRIFISYYLGATRLIDNI